MKKILSKLVYIFVLIFTAAVIVMGALLPKVTADFQDADDVDKVVYNDMQTLKFDVKETYATDVIGKMYLLAAGSAVEIPSSAAKLSVEEMLKMSNEKIQEYIDAKIFILEYNYEIVHYYTVLVYNDPYGINESEIWFENDTAYPIADMSFIYWIIEIQSFDEYHERWENITICLDDETGEILLFQYECPGILYEMEDYGMVLDNFHDVYFQMLNRVAPDMKLNDFAKSFKDYNSYGPFIEYWWEDDVYGELHLRFQIDNDGMRIDITPNMLEM